MRLVLILAVALNGLAFEVSAQSADSTPLAALNTEVRDDIARICLPIQYRDGAEAYRICVKDQVSAREETQRVDKVMAAFSNLSFDDRYAIQQACGSQNTRSARNCISNQITELLTLPEPQLSQITTDEQYVMQQTCFHAQSKQGAAVYRQCQLNEIASVKDVAVPNYANLDIVDRNTLQLKCSANQSRLLDYRGCLVSGSQSLKNAAPKAATVVAQISQPVVDVPSSPRAALVPPTATVRVQTNPVTIRPTLIQSTNAESVSIEPVPSTEPVSIEPVPVQPVSEPALAKAIEAQPVLTSAQNLDQVSQPQAQTTTELQPAEAVTTTENAATQIAAENSNAAVPLESATNAFDTLKNFVLRFATDLSTQGKMLLGAIVFMPLALWALLSGRKTRDHNDDYDESEYADQDLKSRVRPKGNSAFQNSRFNDTETEISANWEAEVDSLFDDAPTLHPETVRPQEPVVSEVQQTTNYAQIDEYAPTRLIKPAAVVASNQQQAVAPTQRIAEEPTIRVAPPTAPITAPKSAPEPIPEKPSVSPAQQSGFASWLHSLPTPEQHSLAIEFVLYWIAFGDERYEPSQKQKIFQNQNPSNKDIVKRWVLKEDVHAFADAIDWLQRNTTAVQKLQTVRLLMAMLVNGHEPTPVQNTMFRFLSDAFYLKDPTLEEMFEEDFQATLPAIPRVDRMAWWDRQSAGTITSWNARKLNNSDEITRLAAQLGVDGEARSEHVESAYELAARRCSAERFDHLSENEHNLILSRRSRLQQARDGLLEALA